MLQSKACAIGRIVSAAVYTVRTFRCYMVSCIALKTEFTGCGERTLILQVSLTATFVALLSRGLVAAMATFGYSRSAKSAERVCDAIVPDPHLYVLTLVGY